MGLIGLPGLNRMDKPFDKVQVTRHEVVQRLRVPQSRMGRFEPNAD